MKSVKTIQSTFSSPPPKNKSALVPETPNVDVDDDPRCSRVAPIHPAVVDARISGVRIERRRLLAAPPSSSRGSHGNACVSRGRGCPGGAREGSRGRSLSCSRAAAAAAAATLPRRKMAALPAAAVAAAAAADSGRSNKCSNINEFD